MCTTGNLYLCSIEGCKYKTPFSKRMKEHTNAHQGIFSKKVICVICNKQFQRLQHLRRHQILHVNAKQASCELCKYKTARQDKLREHVKRMHPEKAVELGLLTEREMAAVMEKKLVKQSRLGRPKRHKVFYNEDGSPSKSYHILLFTPVILARLLILPVVDETAGREVVLSIV